MGDYMGNEEFERQFIGDISEYIKKLKIRNEMERLWAVAKIEEKCQNHGIPKSILGCLLRLIENDGSAIVRGFSIRALYHQSSETTNIENFNEILREDWLGKLFFQKEFTAVHWGFTI